MFCDIFLFDRAQRAIARYHLPIAATYSHQRALQGGQRSSGLLFEQGSEELPKQNSQGRVYAKSFSYPSGKAISETLWAPFPQSDIPRNFNATLRSASGRQFHSDVSHCLRYECGAARQLKSDTASGHIQSWNITCQWNKTWSPAPELPACDWVCEFTFFCQFGNFRD